ncbi:MAG: glycoside hydrolase [Actinomycetota bacterium]|nr:glycoside hydrolase [Actinomycetota bacterium]
MGHLSRGSVIVAVGLVLTLAGTASSAISWGKQRGIPRAYSWNYGDSLDFSGTPADPSFRLHDVFISDAATPQAAYFSSSQDGITWTTPRRLSGGVVNAEGASIAAAGTRIVVGWVTGFSAYDPAGARRRLQVNTSTDGGSTWRGIKSLTPRTGRIDYPIVAAAKTGFGPVNLYAVWIDATNGKVYFRERSGAGAWSVPLSIGATTLRDRVDGYHGYANVAAVGNLITVAWIADPNGSLKARAINLSGKTPTAATTRANWNAPVALGGRVSFRQGGYPVVSASPLAPGVVTIAWNTPTKQVYTTFDGTEVTPTPTTIWINGTANGIAYAGGYSTVVEPAPGGFIAMWAGCENTSLTNDCNSHKEAARVDLLSATSANGSLFTPPSLVAPATSNGRTLNDQASVVATSDHVYVQYNAYTANFGRYDIFARIGTGSP